MLVLIAFAQSAEDLGANPSLRPSSLMTGLLLEERTPQPLSRNENAALRPMDHFKECELCPEMIVVPAGQFSMGASENEPGSTPDERPQHRVSFAKMFSVGRFARKRAGVLHPHPTAAYHLRHGYSSAIYHPHRIEASSVTCVDGPYRTSLAAGDVCCRE